MWVLVTRLDNLALPLNPGGLQGTPKASMAVVPLKISFAKGGFAGRFWAAQESASGALSGASVAWAWPECPVTGQHLSN